MVQFFSEFFPVTKDSTPLSKYAYFFHQSRTDPDHLSPTTYPGKKKAFWGLLAWIRPLLKDFMYPHDLKRHERRIPFPREFVSSSEKRDWSSGTLTQLSVILKFLMQWLKFLLLRKKIWGVEIPIKDNSLPS